MWFLLCLLTTYTIAMRVREHHPPPSPPKTIASITSTQERSDWLIVIRGPSIVMSEAASDAFVDTTESYLTRDSCTLLLSRTSSRMIILRVSCSGADTPQLTHTMSFFETRFNEKDTVIVERNVVVSRPTQVETNHLSRRMVEEEDLQSQSPAEWHLSRIDKRRNPTYDSYTYRNDARDVDIYTLDTGVRATHVEFEGRAIFLANTLRDNINSDCNGHGTHVAGIAISRTFGVAKKATLLAVRVLGCDGNGILDDILEGIDIVVEYAEKRAPRRSIINLSLGGKKNAVMDMMVELLREDANMVVILAAGNENSDACAASPSNMGFNNYVLTVASSDIYDRRPPWSNYGACVSISAPGSAITSTWHTSTTALAVISGTSMSAPVVSGVAAMILQENPRLSVSQVNDLIIRWATPNTVGLTSNTGGASSLIFSLIDSSTVPDAQEYPASNGGIVYTDMILCVAITLLYLTCLS